ncbi:MAG: MerR family DNA-binding transcriptional regulator, partial [Pseudomonadota bacterium]
MNIGQAAAESGLPAKTIRYYEEIGLVTPTRRENGYRDYDVSDVRKLQFVR